MSGLVGVPAALLGPYLPEMVSALLVVWDLRGRDTTRETRRPPRAPAVPRAVIGC